MVGMIILWNFPLPLTVEAGTGVGRGVRRIIAVRNHAATLKLGAQGQKPGCRPASNVITGKGSVRGRRLEAQESTRSRSPVPPKWDVR